MTRDEAFEALLQIINECVPEEGDDWPKRRHKIRTAATQYCHIAVAEVQERNGTLIDEFKRGIPGHPDNEMGM